MGHEWYKQTALKERARPAFAETFCNQHYPQRMGVPINPSRRLGGLQYQSGRFREGEIIFFLYFPVVGI